MITTNYACISGFFAVALHNFDQKNDTSFDISLFIRTFST